LVGMYRVATGEGRIAGTSLNVRNAPELRQGRLSVGTENLKADACEHEGVAEWSRRPQLRALSSCHFNAASSRRRGLSEQVDIGVDLGAIAPPLQEILSLRQLAATAQELPQQIIEGLLY
jgi:hypothetical protein